MGGLALLLGAGAYVFVGLGWRPWGIARADAGIASVQVVRGDLEILLKTTGEAKALKSVTLAAPSSVMEVNLVKVAKSGSKVQAGDVVIEINAIQEQNKVREQQSNMKQSDAEIDKVKAQQRITDEQNRLDLAQAEFDVASARLDVKKTEIVSEIDAGKAKLALETAQRKLVEVQQRMEASKRSQAAEVDQVSQKRKKALSDFTLAESNIKRLTIRSPIDGIISLLPNNSARGIGMDNAPEYKAGDRAWPGAAIAEIPDLSSLMVELNIEETDRGRVAAGQAASIKVKAISDKPVRGKLRSISTLSQASFASWPPVKTFRAIVDMETLDPRLRPGMSAAAEITVDRLPNVILIPLRASFDHGGKVMAYVLKGNTLEPRQITLGRRNEFQVEVRTGLTPGERVALEEPVMEQAAPGAPRGKS